MTLPTLHDPVISGDTLLAEDESLRPLHDLTFVRRVDAPDAIGCIILPDNVKENERSCHGKVIAAGPGRQLENGEREPMDIAVDDDVMWDGGTGINHREWRKGSGIVIVSQRDVLFVARDVSDEEWAAEAPRYEPGGDRYRQPDEQGYWPVGKHLPQWLRDEIKALDEAIERGHDALGGARGEGVL